MFLDLAYHVFHENLLRHLKINMLLQLRQLLSIYGTAVLSGYL